MRKIIILLIVALFFIILLFSCSEPEFIERRLVYKKTTEFLPDSIKQERRDWIQECIDNMDLKSYSFKKRGKYELWIRECKWTAEDLFEEKISVVEYRRNGEWYDLIRCVPCRDATDEIDKELCNEANDINSFKSYKFE